MSSRVNILDPAYVSSLDATSTVAQCSETPRLSSIDEEIVIKIRWNGRKYNIIEKSDYHKRGLKEIRDLWIERREQFLLSKNV